MKKKVSVLLVLVLSLSLVVGCKGKGEEVKEEVKEEIKETEVEDGFIEEDGKLVYLEGENVPVDSPALKIIVDKDEN